MVKKCFFNFNSIEQQRSFNNNYLTCEVEKFITSFFKNTLKQNCEDLCIIDIKTTININDLVS